MEFPPPRMSHTLMSTISGPIPNPHDNAQYKKQSLFIGVSFPFHQFAPIRALLPNVGKKISVCMFKQFLVGGFFLQ